MQFAGILGLVVNAGFAAVVAKTRRRDLAAGVAIDATLIHEKIAVHILRQPLFNPGHKGLDSLQTNSVA
jgi:hypothetical protein